MKKYLFGIGALVLAIAFSAFTKPNFATKVFTYSPQGADAGVFTEAAVERETNWILTEVACVEESDERACSFAVNITSGQEANYYNTTTGRLLTESGSVGVTIFANQFDLSNGYLTDVKKSSASIHSGIENIDKP